MEGNIVNYITQIRGVSYKPSDLHDSLNKNSIILLRANNIDEGKINFEDVVYVDKSKVSETQILRENDILICASSGSKNLVGKAASFNGNIECTFGAFCKVIRPRNILGSYLSAFFQSKYYRFHISQFANGVNINNIKNEHINSFSIPERTLEEQKEISYKVFSLNRVIENYNRELELLDELVKARFVEMFGEYETSVKLSRYIKELRAGKSLAGKTKCKNKVLKTGAATFGFFDKEQYKYYPIDYVPNPLHKVEDGDVIISRMNTPELVGSCSYVFEAPEDMYYPDRLWKTIITEDTNPIFLWQLMWQQDIRKQIKENSFGTSGTMNNISKVKLLNIKAIDVPLELQEKYASFVEEIDKSRSRIQKSLEASQELFDSLMQEYFG